MAGRQRQAAGALTFTTVYFAVSSSFCVKVMLSFSCLPTVTSPFTRLFLLVIQSCTVGGRGGWRW